MTSAEVCRAQAKSAVKLLAELASEEDQMHLLLMARAWLKKAESLERERGQHRPRRAAPRSENGAREYAI